LVAITKPLQESQKQRPVGEAPMARVEFNNVPKPQKLQAPSFIDGILPTNFFQSDGNSNTKWELL
jgi:hypothetical protein